MKFNINNSVRVKLNERGRMLHRLNYTRLWAGAIERGIKPAAYQPPQEDAEGYTRFQLWDLMKEFGPHVSLGHRTPFDTDILIP